MQDAEAIVIRFIEEVWNGRAPRLAADLVAPDYATRMVQASSVGGDGERGAAYVERDVAIWTSAFPDMRWHVDDLVAVGDRAVVRFRWTGTHEGGFLGVPATGRHVEVAGVYVARVSDGRIAEAWLSWDRLGLFQQLGLVGPTDALLAGRSAAG